MITSVGNPTVRRVRRLRKRMWRERTSRVLVEGHRSISAALDRVRVDIVLYGASAARLRADVLGRAQASGARMHEVADPVMAYLTSATTAPDMLAVAAMRESAVTSLRAPAIVLSEVRDPAALGSIMATAVAAGMQGVAVTTRSADVFEPKVIRAAQGAHFRTTLVRGVEAKDAVRHLRAEGARIVALAEEGVAPWDADLTGPVGFVVAGETGSGEEAALADVCVAVPWGEHAPSLAARTAAVLSEWIRQEGSR